MAAEKRKPGRPRKATPIPTKSGQSVRVWVEQEGEKVRRQLPMGTRSPAVARARGRRILGGESPELLRQKSETFEAAARRIVGASEIETKAIRLSRLERYAFPVIGAMAVTDIDVTHVKDCLAEVEAALGWTGSVRHLKNDISAVLGVLFSDNVVKENAALRIAFKRKGGSLGGRRIQRVTPQRIVLTDAEYEKFFAHQLAEGNGQLGELGMLALICRCLGGMRTSDLHAWRWEHIDTSGWADAFVPNEKQEREEEGSARHAIPAPLVPHLIAWWGRHGRPSEGPVFPCRRGKRAGEHKLPGVSYAEALRDALWAARVVRPLPGFERATGDAQRALCAIQAGTKDSQGKSKLAPVDFHSGRRAAATAAANAPGLSTAQAMAVTNHRDVATWQKYQAPGQRVVLPESSVPTIVAPSTPLLPPASGPILNDFKRARKDSNLRPLASEDSKLAPSAGFSRGFVAEEPQPSHEETPGNETQRQNSAPLLQGTEGALQALVAAAIAEGDLEYAASLIELARRRRAPPPDSRHNNVRPLDAARKGKS